MRALREASGLTGDTVARRASMSAGKLSKIENERVRPSVQDVDLVLAALGESEAAKEEFMAAARAEATETTAWRLLRRRGQWKHQNTIKAIEDGTSTRPDGRRPRLPPQPLTLHPPGTPDDNALRAAEVLLVSAPSTGLIPESEQVRPSTRRSTGRDSMTLRFIGKDPESGDHGSPAVWVDEESKDLVIQGWTADDRTTGESSQDVPIPGHESVIRIPKRMMPLLREALGVADSD
ncbi:helix-turn-helix domain-containing protein [Streptomyces laurentii]|uniref:helix-turn-helix domain-containing protein n=1 Tax=Streptomyces laurentii TaxID=39478 RepID=UPI0036A61EAF